MSHHFFNRNFLVIILKSWDSKKSYDYFWNSFKDFGWIPKFEDGYCTAILSGAMVVAYSPPPVTNFPQTRSNLDSIFIHYVFMDVSHWHDHTKDFGSFFKTLFFHHSFWSDNPLSCSNKYTVLKNVPNIGPSFPIQYRGAWGSKQLTSHSPLRTAV